VSVLRDYQSEIIDGFDRRVDRSVRFTAPTGSGKTVIASELADFHVQRGGRRARVKGDRIEREIVSRHVAIRVKAERYPLSGASRFRGSGHDVEIYVFGTDEAPLVAEVKLRRFGAGFVTLEKWLREHDYLFLRRNSAEPMVLLPALLARLLR
jgi:hypothetical protein